MAAAKTLTPANVRVGDMVDYWPPGARYSLAAVVTYTHQDGRANLAVFSEGGTVDAFLGVHPAAEPSAGCYTVRPAKG